MLSPIRLLLALVSLAAPLALDAQEAETPLLSFDDPAPERQWGLNLVEKKGEVKLETVTGPDGGKALRMRAENAGRHALTSPMIPDGPWRGRKHGGLAFWYRGDGTRHMTTLVVATRREDQKGFHTYIVRLFHYDKEWRRIELRHIAHAPGMPDPDFSQLAFLRFENSASYDLTVSAFTLLPANEITRVKPLQVETPLVAEGRPAATIVAPPTPLGQELAKRVQARVKALTRQELPVVAGDKVTPRDLLRQQHAVALGCMADNPFIERLYWEWFTLVDRWYPGPGGHVLQSLHNPYGTGRNAIVLGASDDDGLRAAVVAFDKALAKGPTLPWLLEAKLGAGHEIPADPESIPILLRPFADSAPVQAGWSPAGKLMLQYLYSGDPAFVERFKKLVQEKPESISQADHYGGGQTQCLVWDLIEESPLFSDAERLTITKLLLAHLRSGQAAGSIDRLIEIETGQLPDRHFLTPMQAVANSGRYFARDYPNREFDYYVQMSDRFFAPLMKNSKTQCDLDVSRLTTYLEPVLHHALRTGREDFLRGEPLRLWAERIVAHVPPMGEEGRFRPFITLRTAAQVRRDGQYRYVADLALAAPPVSLYEFSSGQAWAGDVQPVKPTRCTGVVVVPPEPWEFEFIKAPVKPEHGFDKVTFRSGFDPEDLWLMLEGVEGGPEGKRNQDVNAIKWLARFGYIFLRWWSGSQYSENAVTVSRDGQSQEPPRASELVATADLPSLGYVHARTKDYPWSHWSRHIVWDKPNDWIAVFDRVSATEPGHFVMSAHWIPYGAVYHTVDGQVTGDAGGFRIVCRREAKPPATLHVRNVLGLPSRQGMPNVPVTLTGGPMNAGDERWLVHLLAFKRGDDAQPPAAQPLAPNAFLVKGEAPTLMAVGPTDALFGADGKIAASAHRLSPRGLHLVAATELVWKKPLLHADRPVDVELSANGSGTIVASQTTQLGLAASQLRVNGQSAGKPAGSLLRLELTKGRHTLDGLSWVGDTVREMLAKSTESEKGTQLFSGKELRPLFRAIETLPERLPTWSPVAAAKVIEKPTAFAAEEQAAVLGYGDGTVRAVELNGKERWTFSAGKAVTGLALASGLPWRVLAGSDDGFVYALDANGKKVWASELRPAEGGERRSPYVSEFLLADLTGDGVPEVIAPNTERWLVALRPQDGSELWATRIPPNYRFGDLVCPRALRTKDGPRIVIGDSWFYGGGWKQVDARGQIVGTFGGMWVGGRVSGIAVADFDGDGAADVCVARYRVIDTIEHFTGGTQVAWKVRTDEPVTALVALSRPQAAPLIVAGTRSGWIMALDAKGQVVWRHCLTAGVKHLAPLAGSHLAATLQDGRVLRLDWQGQVHALAKLSGPDHHVAAPPSGSALFVVTANGELTRFEFPK